MDVRELVSQARDASRALAGADTDRKDRALRGMADGLEEARELLLAENARDVGEALARGVKGAFVDRLTMTERSVRDMAQGIREIAAMRDPVGEIVRMWRRPNGLLVGKMRIPLGVVGVIYESRPNVTADAAALCFKSGNAVVLRGGSEAIHSNRAIAAVLREAVEREGLPPAAITLIPVADRAAVMQMLRLEDLIDVIIPRGGEALIRTVVAESRIPVIKHYKGVCHVFVDASADLDMAEAICINAKVQRPAVCNAVETLLVHEGVARDFVPRIVDRLASLGVEIRGCPETQALVPEVRPAGEEDWSTEYSDLILSVRVVQGLEAAMEHIARYGSDHTESIVTRDYANAQRFLREVQSSVVMVNASTRFSDGAQLGLGAEIGISTTRLHAYGPMGAEELTTTKFIIQGEGQVRP
jgi:glutamate-5-semialdehyde dehydrogenase